MKIALIIFDIILLILTVYLTYTDYLYMILYEKLAKKGRVDYDVSTKVKKQFLEGIGYCLILIIFLILLLLS